MKILAVDPGKNNGVALGEIIDSKITLRYAGVLQPDKYYEFLQKIIREELPVDEIVLEDWKTRPKEARAGAFDFDTMLTARMIGATDFVGFLLGIPVILQQASIKPVGYGYSGQKYVKNAQNRHHLDAAAHLIYRAVAHYKCVPPAASILKA